jgi:hypothetical protein
MDFCPCNISFLISKNGKKTSRPSYSRRSHAHPARFAVLGGGSRERAFHRTYAAVSLVLSMLIIRGGMRPATSERRRALPSSLRCAAKGLDRNFLDLLRKTSLDCRTGFRKPKSIV